MNGERQAASAALDDVRDAREAAEDLYLDGLPGEEEVPEGTHAPVPGGFGGNGSPAGGDGDAHGRRAGEERREAPQEAPKAAGAAGTPVPFAAAQQVPVREAAQEAPKAAGAAGAPMPFAAAQQAPARVQNPYGPLFEKYPALAREEDLQPGVWRLIAEGCAPLPAYEYWRLQERAAELETALKAKTADEHNRQTLPGSARGAEGGGYDDAFLRGFFSERF